MGCVYSSGFFPHLSMVAFSWSHTEHELHHNGVVWPPSSFFFNTKRGEVSYVTTLSSCAPLNKIHVCVWHCFIPLECFLWLGRLGLCVQAKGEKKSLNKVVPRRRQSILHRACIEIQKISIPGVSGKYTASALVFCSFLRAHMLL